MVETGQSLPALVTIIPSKQNRLAEIKAAYVYPLNSEIAERLRQVDERLCHPQIQQKPFKILSPEEFIKAIYRGETAAWLQEILAAARREQWHNLELLDLVLTYIAPTFLPNLGSYIPYDPIANLEKFDKLIKNANDLVQSPKIRRELERISQEFLDLSRRLKSESYSFSARMHPNQKKIIFRNLSYFDVMNLAPWIECPVLMSIGLRDKICPPRTNFAVFNYINAPKEYRIYPDAAHEGGGPLHAKIKAGWIKKHFGIE